MWELTKPTWNPRSEQLRALEIILRGEGARLFLHPGKGKTSVVLKAFDILKRQGFVDCLLVLAPLRVVTTSWPAQMGKWADFDHLTYSTLHGDRESALDVRADVYLMNNEGLLSHLFRSKNGNPSRTITEWLRGKKVMLAIDESTKYKNPNTSRYKIIKKLLPYFKYNVIMTGTPKPKSLEDVFAQCYLTDGGRDLGKFITHFRHQYMYPDPSGFGFQAIPGAFERVAEKIAPTTIQLEYEEAVPSEVIERWLPVPEAMRQPYKELQDEFITLLGDKTVIAPNAGVLFGKLRQIAQGALYVDGVTTPIHDTKLDALEGIIEELSGESILVMVAYKSDVERIRERLGAEIPYIGSGTSAKAGAVACERFAAGDLPLLLAHPQSAAHGIDGLQNSCRVIVWYGLDPSYENFYQGNLRVVREGSRASTVLIYKLLMDCGVEKAIDAMVVNKQTSEAEFCGYLRKYMLAGE